MSPSVEVKVISDYVNATHGDRRVYTKTPNDLNFFEILPMTTGQRNYKNLQPHEDIVIYTEIHTSSGVIRKKPGHVIVNIIENEYEWKIGNPNENRKLLEVTGDYKNNEVSLHIEINSDKGGRPSPRTVNVTVGGN